MRIAIITLPLHGNYGGILQNYALQTVLKRMGHKVETIVQPWQLHLPVWRMPLAYGKRIVKKYLLRRRARLFYEGWYNRTQPMLLKNMRRFVSKHIATREVKCFSDIREGEYDAFVVGSDQIWRPIYSYKPITLAYLDFAKDWNNVRRVAYAASFGTDKWEYTPKQTEQCAALARLFDGVSVREEAAVKTCQKHLHCEALHVLDPTMLLKAEDYVSLFEGQSLEEPRGQLLTYVLDETPEKARIIREVAERHHYEVYRANSRYEDGFAPLEERVQPPVEQWLKDFHDARFVITDSFHATVFSILFGKPFVVIGNADRGLSRIHSLLRMFGLEEHLVHSVADLDLGKDYVLDAGRVNEVLDARRREAMAFLKNNLR